MCKHIHFLCLHLQKENNLQSQQTGEITDNLVIDIQEHYDEQKTILIEVSHYKSTEDLSVTKKSVIKELHNILNLVDASTNLEALQTIEKFIKPIRPTLEALNAKPSTSFTAENPSKS